MGPIENISASAKFLLKIRKIDPLITLTLRDGKAILAAQLLGAGWKFQ
jgi:hypothetical protein